MISEFSLIRPQQYNGSCIAEEPPVFLFFSCELSECSCRALLLQFMDEKRTLRTKPGSARGGILLPTNQTLVKLPDLHQITLCPRLKLIANPCPRMQIIPQCYHNGLVLASKMNDNISCSAP